jgi:DNA processing protein
MDRQALCAVLARAPALYAHHLSTLVAAADGDLTRSLEPDALSRLAASPGTREWLLHPDSTQLTADLEWIEKSGVRLLASTDSDYPRQLLQLANAPPVLFVFGDAAVLSTRQLAMVGARSASIIGCRRARQFARYFVGAGLTITSGLAMGIDAASHEGALQGGGATVAVCATGLDIIYPTQHCDLARRISHTGALISAFPPGTPPLRRHFPMRNRLVSGLSLGTLVLEATQSSGSLITAHHARSQGRMVFAVPGGLNNGLSRGCHQLIREGAQLVEEPSQVLRLLKIPVPNERVAGHPRPVRDRGVMDKGYEMLLDAVGFEPATVDVLALRTGLPGESVASMLLTLELEGHIAPHPGGRFGRIS